MDDEESERDYDTDTVATASTVSSTSGDNDNLYDAEHVLAEQLFEMEDGTDKTLYLIKWLNYPMHRCTWEPIEHLEGTTLMPEWEYKKEATSEDSFEQYCHHNIARCEEAVRVASANKARRKEKRAKKRRATQLKGKRRVMPVVSESESDDDIPLLKNQKTRGKQVRAAATPSQVRQAEDDTSLFISDKEKRVSRKLPIEQSSGESSVASDDSLMQELRTNEKKQKHIGKQQEGRRSRRASPAKSTEKSKILKLKISTDSLRKLNDGRDPRQERASKPSANAPKTLPSENGSNLADAEVRRGKGPSETTATQRRGSNSASALNVAPAPAAVSIAPKVAGPTAAARNTTTGPNASMKRTSSASKGPRPIRMVNQPKAPLRKAWQKSDKQYTTLHYRAVADKRSRVEGTPDPTALEWVNGPPDALEKITEARPQAPTPNDNPYSRREVGRRRLQEIDMDDAPQESSKSTAALQPYEVAKVPLVCFEWRNGTCRFGAEKCRFLHRDNDPSGRPYKLAPWEGQVPPKYSRPPVTCYYWFKGDKGCRQSADECMFAHVNTGLLAQLQGRLPIPIDPSELPVGDFRPLPKNANPPVTCWYWLRTREGCQKSADVCKFAHYNTGVLGNSDQRPFEQIDRSEMPVHVTAAPRFSIPTGPRSRLFLKPKEMTCFFWSEGTCKHSDDECQFQHRNMGIIADPPRGYKPKPGRRYPVEHQEPDLGLVFPVGVGSRPVPGAASSSEPSQPVRDVSGSFTPPVQPSAVIPPPLAELVTTRLSCLDLKHKIQAACNLDFEEMFIYNGDENGDTPVDRRAFLIFHPEDHVEELELITRWLLLNHVEVYNLWFNGAWESFKHKLISGGSGVIIVHPEFDGYSEIPDFGSILKAKVRFWCVGVQEAYEYDPQVSTWPPFYRYDRIEIFPHGGLIYLTDDVFEKKPVEALKIVELFFAKIEKCRQVAGPIDPAKRVDDGCLLWRLAVRPELMQSLYDNLMQHEAEITAGDPLHVSRLKLYELLQRTGYIEQDDPGPFNPRPDDYFPIISERGDIMHHLYYPALERAQEEANFKMVEYFGGVLLDQRHYYRQYFVVHTEPEKVKWREQICLIDEIMTPEKCIWYFEQEPKGNRFDFYEWAFPAKIERADSGV